MAFLTIQVAAGLPREARARARASGPRAVDTRAEHGTMLRRAGFDVVVERDVTSEFLSTARAWLRESEALTAELEALEPAGGFDERQEDRRTMIAAVEAGLLRRTLYAAVRRGRRGLPA
jgi:hypothetical protein